MIKFLACESKWSEGIRKKSRVVLFNRLAPFFGDNHEESKKASKMTEFVNFLRKKFIYEKEILFLDDEG